MKGAVFFNGGSGSLGRYMPEGAKRLGIHAHPLTSRLEDTSGLTAELASRLPDLYPGGTATLLQLAAFVSVPDCEKDPARARKINVVDTVATVETFIIAARRDKLIPRIIFVSTGHIYAPKAGRLSETDTLKPRSVYASTKLEAEGELSRLCARMNTPLTIARVFGLIAPVQPAHYVLQSVIRRAREKNLTSVPGLSNLRDYLDSRDVCVTLLRLAEIGSNAASSGGTAAEILNVCSGEGVEIAYLLETALSIIHPKEFELLCETITEGPARADDIPEIIGDPTKVEKILGRNPKNISIEQTVRDAITDGFNITC